MVSKCLDKITKQNESGQFCARGYNPVSDMLWGSEENEYAAVTDGKHLW